MKIFKNLRKRGLALFLVLTMCMSFLPTTALADWSQDGSYDHSNGNDTRTEVSLDTAFLQELYRENADLGDGNGIPTDADGSILLPVEMAFGLLFDADKGGMPEKLVLTYAGSGMSQTVEVPYPDGSSEDVHVIRLYEDGGASYLPTVTAEEMYAMYEAFSAGDEIPAEDEILAEDETPAEDEILAEDETPAEDEILAEDETPAEDEILAGDEAPAEDEAPVVLEQTDIELFDAYVPEYPVSIVAVYGSTVDANSEIETLARGGNGGSTTTTVRTGKLIPQKISNAEVAYSCNIGGTGWSDLTVISADATEVPLENYTSEQNCYVVCFVKPADNCLLVGLGANPDGNGDLYPIDLITTTGTSRIANYPNLWSIQKTAKDAGYIAAFGWSRANADRTDPAKSYNFPFTVEGQRTSLGVTAVSDKEENVKPGDNLTFTITLTPASVSGKVEVTNINITSLTINDVEYTPSSLVKQQDGTYRATVQYQATEKDCNDGAVVLDVAAKVSYSITLGLSSGAVTTNTTVENTAQATCLIAPSGSVTYRYEKATGTTKDLPEQITATLPTDSTTYYAGNSVPVKATPSTPVTTSDGSGTWTFEGWYLGGQKVTASTVTMGATPLNFVGYWSYAEIPPVIPTDGGVVKAAVDSTGETITTVEVNDTVTYTVTVTPSTNDGLVKNLKIEDAKLNSTNRSAATVTVNGVAAAHTISEIPGGNGTGAIITLTVATRNPIVVTYTYTVTANDKTTKTINGKDVDVVTNTAKVTAWNEVVPTTPTPTPSNVVDLTVIEPDVSVEKRITQVGDRTIAKGAAVGKAYVGEVITWEVKVTNNGTAAARNVKVAETFKVGGEAADGLVIKDGDTLVGLDTAGNIDVGTLAANGGSKTYTVTYTVQSGDKNKTISNGVAVGNSTDEATIEVSNENAISVEKTAKVNGSVLTASQKVSAGDTITYEIKVTNNGNKDLTNVEIADTFVAKKGNVELPRTFTYTDTTNVSHAGGKFTIANLPYGTNNPVIISYTYTVQPEDAGLTLKNTAVCGNDDEDPKDEVEVNVGTPAFTVNKSVSGVSSTTGKAKVNDTLTYTITVKNTGDVDLKNLVITDTMTAKLANEESGDDRTNFGSVSAKIGETAIAGFTYNETSKAFSAFDLAEGATATITYTYTVTKDDAGKTLSNIAASDNDGAPDEPDPTTVTVDTLKITEKEKTLVIPVGNQTSWVKNVKVVDGKLVVTDNKQPITLLFKITVKGDPGAKFTLADNGATVVAGNVALGSEIELPANGELEVLVTMEFIKGTDGKYVNSANGGAPLTNKATVTPSEGTEDKTPDTPEPEAKSYTVTVKYTDEKGNPLRVYDAKENQWTSVADYEVIVPEGTAYDVSNQVPNSLTAVEDPLNSDKSTNNVLYVLKGVEVDPTVAVDDDIDSMGINNLQGTANSDITITAKYKRAAATYEVFYFKNNEQIAAPANAVTKGTANIGDTVALTAVESGAVTGAPDAAFPKSITDGTDTFVYDETRPAEVKIADSSSNIIRVYYLLDNKGNPDDPDEPNGIPDAYEAFVEYKAVYGNTPVAGIPSGNTNTYTTSVTQAYDLRQSTVVDGKTVWTTKSSIEASGMQAKKQIAAAGAESDGYAFDNWTDDSGSVVAEGNALAAQTINNVVGGKTYTFTANYGVDNWNGPGNEPTGGDGIPDKYQALVQFESADTTKGTVTGTGIRQVFTFKDSEGKYTTSGNVTPDMGNVTSTPVAGNVFTKWTRSIDAAPEVDLTGTETPADPMSDVQGGSVITFKAHFAPVFYTVTVEYQADDGAILHKDNAPITAYTETVQKGADYDVSGEIFANLYSKDADGNYINYTLDTWSIDPESVEADSVADMKGQAYSDITITVVYSKDTIGAKPGKPDEPDDMPDKYQARIEYVVSPENAGTLSKTVEVVTLGSEADPQESAEVTAACTAGNIQNSGYAFAEWKTGSEQVSRQKALSDTFTAEGGRTYVFTAVYLEDTKGPKDTGDGTPDAWQAFVKFQIAEDSKTMGFVSADTQVFTFGPDETSGDVQPDLSKVSNVSRDPSKYEFAKWTRDGNNADPADKLTNVQGGTTIVFEAHYVRNDIPYTVEYYYETEAGTYPDTPGKTDSGKGILGAKIPYSMEPGKDNYVLHKVEMAGDGKITDTAANSVVRVYFALDTKGTEDPTVPDGVADRHQVTITYVAADANGTVTGTTSETYTYRTVTLKADGTIESEETNTVHPTVPATVSAKDGYKFSKWTSGGSDYTDNDAVKAVAVTEDMEFAAHFTARNDLVYTVNYLNENGNTVLRTAKTAAAEFGSQITSASEVVAITGYVFDHADKTALTIGTSANVLNLYYAADNDLIKGGDGTPDKYQKVVTYKVENGTWSDGTANDMPVVVTFKEKDDNGTWVDVTAPNLKVPTGMQADTANGYDQTTGAWGVQPTWNAVENGTTEFTYSFARGSFNYTVNYLNENGNTVLRTAKTAAAEFGSQITSASEVVAITGYVFDHADKTALTIGTSANVLNLYYAADNDPIKGGDGIADKNQIVVTFEAVNGTVNGRASVNVVLTKVDGTATLTGIPAAAPNAGYGNGYWSNPAPAAGMELTADTTFRITFTANSIIFPTPDPTPSVTIPDNQTPLAPGAGGMTIEDEEVPLAAPGLNSVDHFDYVKGYSDGTVRPEAEITRAEVATIFFRLMTNEFRTENWATENSFSDVKTGDWYNNAVSTAAKAGLLNGYPEGNFLPNKKITRGEFARIAASFAGGEVTHPGRFSDIEGHWAEQYIEQAAAAGWVTGSNGKFRPNDNITRAEVMVIVNRMLDRVPDADHMLPDMKTFPDNTPDMWWYADVQEATNSHDYERDETGVSEIWTEMKPEQDWTALEKEWATAADANVADVAAGLNGEDESEGEPETEN